MDNQDYKPSEEFNPTLTNEEDQTAVIVNEEAPSEAVSADSTEKKIDNSPVSYPEVTISPSEESIVVAEETPEAPPVELVQPTGPDNSYNCIPCHGSGLLVNSTHPAGRICEACGGTGKQ